MKLRFTLLAFGFCTTLLQAQPTYHLFVGTYTKNTSSRGIYIYRFSAATGLFDSIGVAEAINPSYLALNNKGNRLYAVGETASDRSGHVSAFAFNKKTGSLQRMNTAETGGDNPCYVSVTRRGQWLAVANYSGGSLSVFKLLPNGGIDTASRTVQQYQGSSINKGRQEKPHIHTAMFDGREKNLISADLGTDLIRIKPVKTNSPTLLQPGGVELRMEAGSGPRHVELHPKLPIIYVVEELTGKVSVHRMQGGGNSLLQRLEADTITPAKTDKGSADIHLSPDAKFLYVSNRAQAHNLTIYKVNPKTGLLTTVGYQSTLGKNPRNFAIEPSGKYLLVANQGTNNVVVFLRNQDTGLLTATNSTLSVPSPVCLKLLKE
ncbi:MAG: lactonase family protein [Bacteroidetes bacterium]|nr:MAG: lactonase family protein [Bacteroidota bacterium]